MKVVPLHVMQIQRGGRDVFLPTLDIDFRKSGWAGQSHSCFNPGENAQYIMYRRLSGLRAYLNELTKLRPHWVGALDLQQIARRYTDCVVPTAEMFCATVSIILTPKLLC